MQDRVTQSRTTQSGDHLERDAEGTPAVVANVPERQAVAGHNVRYMLLFGLIGIVVAFAAMWLVHWQ